MTYSLRVGQQASLVLLLAVVVVFLVSLYLINHGRLKVNLRRLPAYDGIAAMVGRATEMGRPVLMVPGGGLGSDPVLAALLPVFGYTAELCAKNKVPIFASVNDAQSAQVMADMFQGSYAKAGQVFDESRVQFYPYYTAWTATTASYIAREKPAGQIILGAHYGVCSVFMEAANSVGAMQIGGTNQLEQLPFFPVICDYSVLGEELYALGAYVSQDPEDLGSIFAEDVTKFAFLAIITVGCLLYVAGNKWLVNILSL